MKDFYRALVPIFLLMALVALACGSSSSVVVSTPIAEAEQQNAQSQEESEETGQVESEPTQRPTLKPTEAPTITPTKEAPLGTRRDNPAPVGSEILTDNMSFMVIGVIRPADDIVKAGNMFNDAPDEGMEYMFVEISITCTKSDVDKCSFSTFDFKALGSKGILYDAEWFLAGIEKELESTEFYGGATVTGYVPFMVGIGEENILLVYEPFLSDSFYLETQSEDQQ